MSITYDSQGKQLSSPVRRAASDDALQNDSTKQAPTLPCVAFHQTAKKN